MRVMSGLSRRPGIRWLVRVVSVLAVAGLVFAMGFEIAHRQLFGYRLLERVDAKIEKKLFPHYRNVAVRLEDSVVPTALVRVETDVGVVDVGRDKNIGALSQNGGGLTSFGGDVLLLPYNGHIYAARGAESIRDTGLIAPDNNRTAYQALETDPDFADYQFEPDYLRYNDIEYFQGPTAHGLVVSYTEYHPERVCYTNTLARLDFLPGLTSIEEIDAAGAEWDVIYRSEPCLPLKTRNLAIEGQMASGRLAFEAPSTIYLSSGDFHFDGMRSDGPPISQDPDAQYGKVLAINLDGGNAKILTMGHRNVQGMVLLSPGRLITVEHGPRGGDEINIIREGANFGWPLESYGTTYNSTPIPGSLSFGRHDQFVRPIHAWVPSVATSGVAQVHNFHPAWDGDLLVASLIDKSLYRVRLDGDRVVYTERIEIGQRLRDVHQHSDGRIVLWTDNEELVFLTGQDLPDRALSVEKFVRQARLGSRVGPRFETEIERCAECHSFQVDDHSKAPSLARIYGNEIGATSFDGYSEALMSASGTWDEESLTAYLTDPQGFAPGTAMSPLEDPELVKHVVDYLRELDASD